MARNVMKATNILSKFANLLAEIQYDDRNQLKRAFELIAIAEQVIDEYKGKHPEVNNLFSALRPESDFGSMVDEVYEHHCHELIKRFIAGQKLEDGTDAEVMMVLSNTSIVAPLNLDGSLAYARIFDKIYGTKNEAGFGKESYAGAIDEMIGEMKRKLRKKR